MEPDEKTFSGELLVDYTSELHEYAESVEKKITVYHFPIKDLSITTPERMNQILTQIFGDIEAGKKVYVHCWGGVGRTGTVIGCFLLEQKMATPENVIETIAYLKRTTSIADRRSPETNEQMDFILNWPVLRSER
jgi:protein-tyrosine phosphatase